MDDKLFAAVIAAGVATVTLIVNVALQERARRHERVSVVTAFRSDIRSIVSVLHRMELIKAYIEALSSPSSPPRYSSWIDAPREEDYFQLFGALSSKIGLTPPVAAREIVRFYTFLRASRDAARPLGAGRQQAIDGKHLDHVRNVLIALAEVLDAAQTVLSQEFSAVSQNEGQELAKELALQIQLALSKSVTPPISDA